MKADTATTLTFSHHLDGGEWTNAPAAAGSLRTGPSGLIRLLESRLGLGGPEAHPAQRIEAWMRRMQAIDEPGLWFHESFEADRWSTAATLLGFRDELVEAGWRPGVASHASPRLKALSQLEALAEPHVPTGRADRLRAVLDEIESLASEMNEGDIAYAVLDISAVTVVDDWGHLSPAWQRLFRVLERCGVSLQNAGDEVEGAIPPRPPTDIDYHLLTANDEWEAAEVVATWLAAGEGEASTNTGEAPAKPGHAHAPPDSDPAGTSPHNGTTSAKTSHADVTLLCGSESMVLDAALGERGLPRIGHGSSSRWRGALQLLPLFLESVWRPVDVGRLAELLSLEYGPVPKRAAERLLHALTQEPGVGGKAWSKALEKIAADITEEKAREFDRLLSTERFDPDEGVPTEVVAERCRIIAERLAPRMQEDPTAATAVGHARILGELCRGNERIPRTMLERMVDTVIGSGAAATDCERQASTWRVVSSPGEIIDSCETVIWWNFTDTGSTRTARWSTAERKELDDSGVNLALPEISHLREAASWRRAAAAARSRLIMVYPKRLRGEDTPAHPYLDELKAAVEETPTDPDDRSAGENINLKYQTAESLFHGREFTFAERRTRLEPVETRAKQTAGGRYPIGRNAIHRPANLSYSSMNDLLGCPMKWTLSNRAKVVGSDAADIPHGNQMIGTLCHRIVELLFPDSHPDPASAEQQALERFDTLVGSMAAELLLPGREVERQRARSAVGLAVRRLAEALERTGLTVESTEEFLQVDVDGVTLRGPADLIARDRSGRAFIIDLKWSGSSRYRREEIERGEALQLAVYSWMVRKREIEGDSEGAHTQAGAAYFMLAQGELLTASPHLGGETLEAASDGEEIFDRAWNSWNERLSQLNNGTLEATGVTQADSDTDELREQWRAKDGLYREPPCRFCDYGWLCGLEDDTV